MKNQNHTLSFPEVVSNQTSNVNEVKIDHALNDGVTADLDPPADLDPRSISASGFRPPRSKSASGYGPPFADLDPPTKLSF